MKGKKGWIRIMEATIAVIIVSGVMLTIYSDSNDYGVTVEEYSKSLQTEILTNIVSNENLRLNVLNVLVDDLTDSNFTVVDDYVKDKVPQGFGYLLRICDLGSSDNFCKMSSDVYISTLDKNVYAKEAIVSAEVGGGGGDEIYHPKKVKIYFWQGALSS